MMWRQPLLAIMRANQKVAVAHASDAWCEELRNRPLARRSDGLSRGIRRPSAGAHGARGYESPHRHKHWPHGSGAYAGVKLRRYTRTRQRSMDAMVENMQVKRLHGTRRTG
jgi:hypothetical protein